MWEDFLLWGIIFEKLAYWSKLVHKIDVID